jgi:hypothetical protein
MSLGAAGEGARHDGEQRQPAATGVGAPVMLRLGCGKPAAWECPRYAGGKIGEL